VTKAELLVFPHQLFARHPGLDADVDAVALVEDNLMFGDPRHTTRFHKQKLWLHRASMKRYAAQLQSDGWSVTYVDHQEAGGTLSGHLKSLASSGGAEVVLAQPHDDLISRRLERICESLSLRIRYVETPMFLNTPEDNRSYRHGRRRWFMADFYKHQRRRLDVLMDGDSPQGGQWSFDKENRKKVPRAMLGQIPDLPALDLDDTDRRARDHVLQRYPDNPGALQRLSYPTSHSEARAWLDVFIRERFQHFGAYEDAIVEGENTLWHSVLTPMLNIGLLTPAEILEATLASADAHNVPLNSLEGFVRQLIGWREFMRATYEDLGVTMRTRNHWGHRRRMPRQFYDGTTGIGPVDDAIHRILETGYCHHIERLMVLGGFMFLCEIDPDDIYTWFMEMFVDSYDWVMVPNVYAMSQHADGGLITTKPYFSGSSYIRKMSNHPRGAWTDVWDGLYWRWVLNHSDSLAKNPRWAMMCAMARKMNPEKASQHRENAEEFLRALDAESTHSTR
jgi:deoxyribodipyrimidine photolyase-related protein